jgi:outer membrane lipoprotein-sorting protein
MPLRGESNARRRKFADGNKVCCCLLLLTTFCNNPCISPVKRVLLNPVTLPEERLQYQQRGNNSTGPIDVPDTMKHTTMKNRFIFAACAAAMIVATISADARSRTGDVREIVKKTKELYNSTNSAEVQFEQEGTTGSMRGTLTYARGNKYRLELGKQTIVSNGTKSWTYIPDRNQVVVSKAASGRGRLTPNDILTSFPGDYSTKLKGETTVNGRKTWIVECVPGDENKIGDVTKATLYIDQGTYRFQQIEVESPSMGKLKLRITSAKYDLKLADSRFSFTAPQGAKVVDLSK